MIIFAIKFYFFSRTNSYCLRQKPHTSHFFFFYYETMIEVIYTILIIIIEDLKIYLNNSNLLTKKNVIWFECLVQK